VHVCVFILERGRERRKAGAGDDAQSSKNSN